MSEELKKCPACGKDMCIATRSQFGSPDMYRGQCVSCEFVVNYWSQVESDAIEFANRQPRIEQLEQQLKEAARSIEFAYFEGFDKGKRVENNRAYDVLDVLPKKGYDKSTAKERKQQILKGIK